MADVTFVFMADEDSAPALTDVGSTGLKETTGKAPELALDPASAVVLTGAVIFAARFVVSLWERWRGGVRIDLGTEPPTVERLHELPYGVVMVLTVDNDVRIQTVDEPKEVVERILSGILSLPSGASSAQVSEAAADGGGTA